MNFAPVLRNPIPERYFGSQDGLQNAPRSAQDGSKRLLKSNFFALENRLKFGLVLDPILVDLGLLFGTLQLSPGAPFSLLKLPFFGMLSWSHVGRL